MLTILLEPVGTQAQPKQTVIIEILNRQLAQASQDSTRLRLCLEIATYYYGKTQYDSLYPYVQRGIKLLTRSSSHTYASELYFFLSRYYRDKGQYRRGIPLLQQAIHHTQQNQNTKRTAELQYYLASLYSDADELSNAVDQIKTNLKYLDLHKDDPTLAANYLLLAALFNNLNNVKLENVYRQKYFALDKRSWPAEDKLIAHLNEAEYLESLSRLKEAEHQYRKAMPYAQLTSTPDRWAMYVIHALGVNLRKQHHYQTAIKEFTETYVRAKLLNDVSYMAHSKRELAIIYLAIQRPKDALSEAQYALHLSRQHKERNDIIASLNSLGAVLEANGRYKEALLLYQEQLVLKEQKFTEANVKKISQMQALFDVETKEKVIKLLQKNAHINQLNTLRQQEQLALAQRTQLAAATIISLLLLVIGLVIYGLRKSRRSNALLTEQKQLLQQTAIQLTETNAVKDKLFSIIGHDLRSPFTTMKKTTQDLRQAFPHSSESNKPEWILLSRLERQIDSTLSLVTNLLDWALIQLKGFDPLLQPTGLADITENEISQASEAIRQKQLVVINQVKPDSCVMADRHQLSAVVRNLLNNAIKFTPSEGYIRIYTNTKADYVEWLIRDTGMGMSAEQVSSLFNSPEVHSGTIGEKGTGLGLKICKEFLERQGGSIQAESSVESGTVITIRLAACS